jgi:hypothetical protein
VRHPVLGVIVGVYQVSFGPSPAGVAAARVEFMAGFRDSSALAAGAEKKWFASAEPAMNKLEP